MYHRCKNIHINHKIPKYYYSVMISTDRRIDRITVKITKYLRYLHAIVMAECNGTTILLTIQHVTTLLVNK